jgi:branched-chain amino acid transport system substrate-binding protein
MSENIINNMDRRRALKVLGIGADAVGSTALLSACGPLKGASSTASDVLKIGLVSPQTGPLASFASGDAYVVAQVKKALSKGFTAGGKKGSPAVQVGSFGR